MNSNNLFKILLVEDNEDHVDLLMDILESSHFKKFLGNSKIHVENSLKKAQVRAQSQNYDVVLLDLKLEDESDQKKVLSGMLEVCGNTPIVVLTSLDDPEFGRSSVKAGAQDFLFKGNLGNGEIIARSISNSLERKILDDELKRSNQELTDFCAIVSHDLLAPIRRFKQFAEVLGSELSDGSPPVKKAVDAISNNASSLQEMVVGLLNYAKIGGSQNIEDVDLNLICLEIKELCEQEFKLKNGNLIFEALPKVKGNKEKIFQLLLNLISNSLKYAKKDTPPKIQIKSKVIGQKTIIKIKDNGIGIPKESRHEIFKPFKRCTNHHGVDGIGLGLATCKRIVDAHGWNIEIDNEETEGTAFIITIC